MEKYRVREMLIRYLAEPIGMNVLRSDFEVTWNTMLVISVAFIYVINVIQTVHIHRHDPFALLEIICTNGLAVSVSFRTDLKKKTDSNVFS